MLGAVITFLAVCAIFGIYMSIVHRFLRAAEEAEDVAREERRRTLERRSKPGGRPSGEPQWAH
jgi:hypothetical protein